MNERQIKSLRNHYDESSTDKNLIFIILSIKKE